MNEKRFKNHLNDNYELFSIVLPHQDLIQRQSSLALKKGLGGKQNPNVLEIGFGTGITTLEILNAIKGIKLISIDSEPEMAECAKKRLQNKVYDFSFLKIQDALNFLREQASESFDGVISVWTVHNFIRKEQLDVLGEIFRVLKKGGVFVNGDKIVSSDSIEYQKDFDWQIKLFDKFTEIGRDDLRISWTEHYKEDAKPDRSIDQNEYEGKLLDVGFKSVLFSNRNHLDVVAIAIK